MEQVNGRMAMNGWGRQLADAQDMTIYEINGTDYDRIPCEDADPTMICHDCYAKVGQLHVPGCDVERCPACGGQALCCDCYDDDDEEI